MGHSSEKMIELCATSRSHLKDLSAGYSRMAMVCRQERDAISQDDVDGAEKIVSEKEQVGLTIELNIQKLMEINRAIARPEDHEKETLSGLVSKFEAYTNEASDDIKDKVLQHNIHQLRLEFEKFQEIFAETRPLVEQNMYIVRKILNRNRENLRIIHEAIDQASSTYSNKGEAKTNLQFSVWHAKA